MKNVPLGEVATIERRGIDPSSLPSETRYLGLEHIERGGRIIGSDTVGHAELASTKFAFTPEHVLYGKLRPNLGKISRPPFSGVCSTDILPIRPGPHLDRDYLAHYLSQPTMIDFAASRTSGANLPRLSPTVLGTFEIPLPPLDKQRRIAGILDRAHDLRVQREEELKRLQEASSAIFDEMFMAYKPDRKLAEGCVQITDGTHQSPEWSSTGVPFIFITNIATGEIDLSTKKFISEETWQQLTKRAPVEVGDVLYSTVGVTYGRPAQVRSEQRFAFQRHIAHIKPKREILDSEFLTQMMASPMVKRQADRVARGAAQPTVNLADIKDFDIILPPIELQREFGRRIECLRSVQRTVGALSERHLELFAALQSRAFSGQL